MKCAFCNASVQQRWKYCPSCGALQTDVFSLVRKEMDSFLKEAGALENDIQAFDLSPFLRSKGGGFSIKIVQTGKNKPKIDVQTFGDIDQAHVQKHVEKQLGVSRHTNKREKQLRSLPIRMRAEEPVTRVMREDEHVIVEIELPNVQKKDIRIQELESSVEVKAVSKDKSFFKILTKPDDCSIVKKEFVGGKLRLFFA